MLSAKREAILIRMYENHQSMGNQSFVKAFFVNFVAIGHKNIMVNKISLLKLVKSLRKDPSKTGSKRNSSLYVKQQSMRKRPL